MYMKLIFILLLLIVSAQTCAFLQVQSIPVSIVHVGRGLWLHLRWWPRRAPGFDYVLAPVTVVAWRHVHRAAIAGALMSQPRLKLSSGELLVHPLSLAPMCSGHRASEPPTHIGRYCCTLCWCASGSSLLVVLTLPAVTS